MLLFIFIRNIQVYFSFVIMNSIFLFLENNTSQSKLEIMTGCENDIFLVIGPSTDRIIRSNPNIVSNLEKDQLWLYVQNMINVTIIRRTGNSGEHFLEVSLHDVDSFWENTNDEYYAQNKGSNVTHKIVIERWMTLDRKIC